MENLSEKDLELFNILENEEKRESETLEMVASESIQPKEALDLAGCAFNNKTAVGRIGNQRLKGSMYADELEKLCKQRVMETFGADHANVVTYSGSVANFCAYNAVLNPGDRVLALDPVTGSHQSHGGKNNVSSKLYSFEYFGLNPNTLDIDYEGAEKKCKEFAPKLIVIGSAAYPRKIDYARLADIAHKNGALLMADIAHFSGLVAGGVSPSPVPFADIVTASTTKTMCGPHSGFIMCKKELAKAVEDSVYPGYVASLHLQTIGAMAYVIGRAKTEQFASLMKKIVSNAQYLCKALKERGFDIFTGGTDCHMFLADLKPFGIDGVAFADRLERAGISVNSKGIPFDPSPVAMGIRLGTTVLTQRGMGEKEMDEIADMFLSLAQKDGENNVDEVLQKVKALCKKFPIKDII
ncbi:MAG: serine hydroxymethyltransferase [Clostridia bacterium]|nr:serine hydroxymethyltransferase [Clostridia bacterium]